MAENSGDSSAGSAQGWKKLIEDLGLTKYIQIFEEQEFDDGSFLTLTETELEKLVDKIGPRKKIINAIKAITSNKDIEISEASTLEEHNHAVFLIPDSHPPGTTSPAFGDLQIANLIPAFTPSPILSSISGTSNSKNKVGGFQKRIDFLKEVLPDKAYNFVLKDVLESDPTTNEILKNKVIDQQKFILMKDRQAVSRVLIDAIFANVGLHPSRKALEELAQNLVQEYHTLGDPTEKEYGWEMWYSYPRNSGHAVGYLQDRLQNQRTRFLQKVKKDSTTVANETLDDMGWKSDKDDENPEPDEQRLLELKIYPSASIKSDMKSTVFERRTLIRRTPFEEVPNIMPRLFDTVGMIPQDFNERHPKLKMNLFRYWPVASKHIVNYALENGIQIQLKLGIAKPIETWNQDDFSLVGFMVLPMLLPHCGRKRKADEDLVDVLPLEKKSTRHKKMSVKASASTEQNGSKVSFGVSSTAEVVDRLILFVSENENILEVLQRCKNISPFIVVRGSKASLNVVQSFVIFRNVLVPCEESFMHALDTCFKSFSVFGFEFPAEALPAWLFIEHGIFRKPYHFGNISVPYPVKALIGQIMFRTPGIEIV